MSEVVIPNGSMGLEGLKCPGCGWEFLHHDKVEVWWRDREDSTTGQHVVCAEGQSLVVDGEMAGNPSGRRDGVTVHLWCEVCGARSFLDLAQHKGHTLLYCAVAGKSKPKPQGWFQAQGPLARGARHPRRTKRKGGPRGH